MSFGPSQIVTDVSSAFTNDLNSLPESSRNNVIDALDIAHGQLWATMKSNAFIQSENTTVAKQLLDKSLEQISDGLILRDEERRVFDKMKHSLVDREISSVTNAVFANKTNSSVNKPSLMRIAPASSEEIASFALSMLDAAPSHFESIKNSLSAPTRELFLKGITEHLDLLSKLPPQKKLTLALRALKEQLKKNNPQELPEYIEQIKTALGKDNSRLQRQFQVKAKELLSPTKPNAQIIGGVKLRKGASTTPSKRPVDLEETVRARLKEIRKHTADEETEKPQTLHRSSGRIYIPPRTATSSPSTSPRSASPASGDSSGSSSPVSRSGSPVSGGNPEAPPVPDITNATPYRRVSSSKANTSQVNQTTDLSTIIQRRKQQLKKPKA